MHSDGKGKKLDLCNVSNVSRYYKMLGIYLGLCNWEIIGVLCFHYN